MDLNYFGKLIPNWNQLEARFSWYQNKTQYKRILSQEMFWLNFLCTVPTRSAWTRFALIFTKHTPYGIPLEAWFSTCSLARKQTQYEMESSQHLYFRGGFYCFELGIEPYTGASFFLSDFTYSTQNARNLGASGLCFYNSIQYIIFNIIIQCVHQNWKTSLVTYK